MPKRILISGITGFIASHIVEHLQVNTDWQIVGLASFRHGGDPLRAEAFDPDRVEIHHADLTAPISDRLMGRIGSVDIVWNVAANSNVDESIAYPRPFIENNVSLAITMLELARELKPEVFIQVGTDEEVGPAPKGTFHKEWDADLPSNPYSASKSAMTNLSTAWWRTYGVPVIQTRTMNNFAERQAVSKFVPMCIAKIYKGQTVTIHGNPETGEVGSRFYLHARNHADALLFLTQNTIPSKFERDVIDRPDRYNVVGEREVDNLEMAQMIADILGKPLKYEIIDAHSARPGHDPRYALSSTKLYSLGWKPPIPLHESLERVIEWTLVHPEWLL
jgi:dTDP-glucose 4,6-dehydratase